MLLGQIDIENIKTIIDCISDGIQVYDLDGYLVYCNEKCEMLDDILSKSAIGKHVTSIYPPMRGGQSTIVRVLRTGKPVHDSEQEYINYRGRRLTAVTTTLPLMQGKKMIGAIEITRSLTENRELSEKIEQLRMETEALRISGDIGMILGASFSGESSVQSDGDSAEVPTGSERSSDSHVMDDEDFIGLEKVMEVFERRVIESVLRQSGFNLSLCAKKLRMPRQTLQYKVKKHGIKTGQEKKRNTSGA